MRSAQKESNDLNKMQKLERIVTPSFREPVQKRDIVAALAYTIAIIHMTSRKLNNNNIPRVTPQVGYALSTQFKNLDSFSGTKL